MIGETAFDPLRLIEALHGAEVDFVVIGGVAARLHGSPTLTRDLDVCHQRDTANLRRLAAALKRLGAKLRGVDDDVPFLLDERTLRAGGSFTFTTDAGDLDILAVPAGTAGYDDLVARADRIDLGDAFVMVSALDDLIRMKRAAGRPKDRAEVEILEALRDEIGPRTPGPDSDAG